MSILRRCYSCLADMSGGATCPTCGWQSGQEPDNNLYLPQGYVLNHRYLIGKVIGSGGFGVVYIAWDNNLDIRVAVKEFLPKELAARSHDHVSLTPYTGNSRDDYSFGVEKFLDEAKALAKFQDHPGIVSVHESFRANGTAYMIMQYLDGMTLKEYLKRQPGEKISFSLAVKALVPIMDALREVHKAGFVHRDVSPDNIFITRQQQVKLLDFGSARYAIGEHSKSLTSVLKQGYAPVEQYSVKGNQGPWSDVYAVAATLYRSITGLVPPDAMDRIQEDTLTSPRQLGVEIPEYGESAIMRGLALKATSRFENIQQFHQALISTEKVESLQGMSDEVVQPRRPTAQNIIECPECGAKNQLNPGDDPSALRCGKCKKELGVVAKSLQIAAITGKPVFKKINHNYYIVSILGGMLTAALSLSITDSHDVLAGFGFIAAGMLYIFAYIYHLVALHRTWQVLQGSTARTTPGSAVARLFIPIYNIYWMFVAYKGLADDSNKFASSNRLTSRISSGLSIALCICIFIPYVNYVLAPLIACFLVYQWSKFCEEVSDNWDDLRPKSDVSRIKSDSTAVVVVACVIGGIFIIGIFSAIAIPQFSAYRIKGYNSQATSDLRNFKTQVESYYSDNKNYPSDITLLTGIYKLQKSPDIEINYQPRCEQFSDQNNNEYKSSCVSYVIVSSHKKGDRIIATTNEDPKLYFKNKNENDDAYRPM